MSSGMLPAYSFCFLFFYFSNSFLYQIKRRRVRQACSAQIADVGVFLRGRADWLRAKCGCIRPVESMGTAVSELQTFLSASLLGESRCLIVWLAYNSRATRKPGFVPKVSL